MKCITKYCRNQRRFQGRFCNTCSGRRWRAKHPARAAYANCRSNAKRRGIQFSITFSYYLIYWKQGMTIDRIKSQEGYVPGNLQTVSLKLNVWKEHFIDKPF